MTWSGRPSVGKVSAASCAGGYRVSSNCNRTAAGEGQEPKETPTTRRSDNIAARNPADEDVERLTRGLPYQMGRQERSVKRAKGKDNSAVMSTSAPTAQPTAEPDGPPGRHGRPAQGSAVLAATRGQRVAHATRAAQRKAPPDSAAPPRGSEKSWNSPRSPRLPGLFRGYKGRSAEKAAPGCSGSTTTGRGFQGAGRAVRVARWLRDPPPDLGAGLDLLVAAVRPRRGLRAARKPARKSAGSARAGEARSGRAGAPLSPEPLGSVKSEAPSYGCAEGSVCRGRQPARPSGGGAAGALREVRPGRKRGACRGPALARPRSAPAPTAAPAGRSGGGAPGSHARRDAVLRPAGPARAGKGLLETRPQDSRRERHRPPAASLRSARASRSRPGASRLPARRRRHRPPRGRRLPRTRRLLTRSRAGLHAAAPPPAPEPPRGAPGPRPRLLSARHRSPPAPPRAAPTPALTSSEGYVTSGVSTGTVRLLPVLDPPPARPRLRRAGPARQLESQSTTHRGKALQPL
ncbi:dapper homolog 3-like [Lontra canadensis]|uniref:dapper homolog 3-like n=1 Tax=Lontra canadensis TaxID=76717 RepID=UPI0013F30974|nr:dapper homolog 3-like [Lontra canadensis]